jgi:hypothetical protein
MSTNYNKDLKETSERKAISKDSEDGLYLYPIVNKILQGKVPGLKIKWGTLRTMAKNNDVDTIYLDKDTWPNLSKPMKEFVLKVEAWEIYLAQVSKLKNTAFNYKTEKTEDRDKALLNIEVEAMFRATKDMKVTDVMGIVEDLKTRKENYIKTLDTKGLTELENKESREYYIFGLIDILEDIIKNKKLVRELDYVSETQTILGQLAVKELALAQRFNKRFEELLKSA